MNSKALLAAAALLLAAPLRAADEVVAVLSAGSGAYLEAFSAFQAAYGSEVPHLDASREKIQVPAGTKVIVTFGTKAAAKTYPPGVGLIYAMAPGFFLDHDVRTGSTVKISMRAEPRQLLAKLAELQPSAKRLRIFWATPGYASFQADYGRAGEALGLEVSALKVDSADELPALLRDVIGKADAFWLPPDPLLISPETLMIFRQFSWDNALPMYASTKGMAREGACASVGISFAEIGAAAARTARALQAGEKQPSLVFPEKLELTLNASAAKRCGVKFSREVLNGASYLFP